MTLTAPDGFRGVFRTDAAARAVYSEAAGIARIVPRAVAQPADAADLSLLLAWASSTGTPVIPRGSGSSMAGGAVGDGVVVDLSRWRRLEPVDANLRTVVAEPGVLRAEIDRAAHAHGLRFPVDPSSGAFCTIGGMVSTNAAGAHSMFFGSTRRWVRAVDCVFADGSHATIRRNAAPPADIPAVRRMMDLVPQLAAAEPAIAPAHADVIKDSSGYALREFSRSRDLVDLLVGSEGTLAVFTRVELDLAPAARATCSVLGAFASLESAAAAAVAARAWGAVACELLDRTFLDVAALRGDQRHVPADTEAVLLAELEGDDPQSAANAAAQLEASFLDAGAVSVRIALDPATGHELWELRHAASPILARLDPNLRSMQFIEDCAVPPVRLAEYIRGVRAILDRYDTRGVIFGHAGDAHVHVNPLVDVSRPDWRERVEGILTAVVELAASLGGTLTGEHGDGRLRTPFVNAMWPAPAVDAFRLVKAAFDPAGILNPGVKLPTPGERAIDAVKYDPALPPLPPPAHRALEQVALRRDYARSRLELVSSAW